MEKYIYKITNTKNGKVYIGQTNNVEKRKREHFSKTFQDSDVNEHGEKKLLYRAMDKYGMENFIFEVIEGPCEDYNDREKYWIKFYNAYIGWDNCNGYNCTEGGDNPPITRGEKCHFCSHSDDVFNLVIMFLSETDMSSEEIGEITGYDHTTITKINNGQTRKQNNLTYPLRKNMSFIGLNERADLIIQDLLFSSLTQKEIAEKFGIARTTVTAINNGKNHKRDDIEYPIRKNEITHGGTKAKSVTMLDIKTLEELQTFKSASEAAKYFNKNRGDVINTAIKNNKTCWGYKWKYTEE